jgi:Domain of unknown function (DUF4385)
MKTTAAPEPKKKTTNPIYAPEYARIDFRQHPEAYRVGIGEQGVLTVEPYKSELLALWRFKTPEIARESSLALERMFERYKAEHDFVGMDMARKFIQMGWTRARRYANHKTGKKYDGSVPLEKRGQSGAHGRPVLPLDQDPVKAEAASIFYAVYERVRSDPTYRAALAHHRAQFEKK